MKLKSLIVLIVLMFVATFSFQSNYNKVYASQDEYILKADYMWIGVNYNYFFIGEDNISVTLLVNFEHIVDGVRSTVEIDETKLKVTSSNESVLSVKKDSNGKVYLKAVSEGIVSLNIKYTYDGVDYQCMGLLDGSKPEDIVCYVIDENSYTSSNTYIMQSKTNVSIEKGNEEVVEIIQRGFDEYGFAADTSCTYECSSSNESIVTVEQEYCDNGKPWDGVQCTITAVSAGEAEVYCDVTAGDTHIRKTINVTVTGDSDEDEYFLVDVDPIIIGPNKALIEVGDSILDEVGLVDQNGSVVEKDSSKLKIEISNPDIVEKKNENYIAKAEGIVDVKYKYEYQGKTYEYETTKCIVGERFENGDIPAINTSIVNMKVGDNGVEAFVTLVRGGSYAVDYPEGYSQDNYYKCEWVVENKNVANITELPENKIKIIPVGEGSTTVTCTIKTADGTQTIKKTIKINVTGADKQADDKKESEDSKSDSAAEEKSNTADKALPDTGVKNVVIWLIVGCTVCCIIMHKKMKNITK